MALISLRQLLDIAAIEGVAIPAFNVNNLEQIQAIMSAADACDSPVILQASAGARSYAGAEFLRHLCQAACEKYPHIPICWHQDHGGSPEVCRQSIDDGFTSVMMDGSLGPDMKTPMPFEYNVRVTQDVVAMAHPLGVSVEGEIGCLGSLETGTAEEEDGSGAAGVLSHEQLLTDVAEACAFVKATGVDALAIAIGTSHGAAKFSVPPDGQTLALWRLKELHAALPETHFVMHGSSSVPSELIETINQYGGQLPLTYGVPLASLVEARRYGVRKINIDTDLRLAATAAIRQYFAQEPKVFDPRKYLTAARIAMSSLCKERFEALGCAGLASKITPKTLKEMAQFYQTISCSKR